VSRFYPPTHTSMKPTMNTLTVLSLLTLGTCIASAQDGAPKGEGGGGRLGEFLKRADTDSDGKISKAEFEDFSKRDTGDRFSKMDANADGFVDKIEMGQIAEKMREGVKGRAGGEGSPGGFRRPGGEGGEGGFRRPPSGSPEGDKPMPKPEGDKPMPRGEGERPPQGGPPGGQGMFDLDEVYGRMDKNADGSVNLEEYTAFSKQEIESRFGRMDENKDGNVSKEEMKAGMERMRNMMRGPGGPGGQGGPGGPGMRRPGGEGGGEGSFRRPPSGEGGTGRPRPEAEGEAPKKDPA